MSECALPTCSAKAKSSCSRCGREQYCSGCCQKADWKIHKPMCPILNKLSTKLQPFHEVIRIFNEVVQSHNRNDLRRIFEHLLSYVNFQFGERITGKDYRESATGERISNWEIEVDILHSINARLNKLCNEDHSMNLISSNKLRFSYLKRSLSLLNPWLIQFDLNASDQIDIRNDIRMNHLLHSLSYAENNMGAVTANMNQLDLAEGHCRRSLAYSRRYGLEGEHKTFMIFNALKGLCNTLLKQRDLSGAKVFAEEAYNFVVEAYDCIHPLVQEAAGLLINILIGKGDYYDAERYAQVTYSNLRDKKNGIDQEGEEIATGAYNLANVIYRQNVDLQKGEGLARESLRIKTMIYGFDNEKVSLSCHLLARILNAQGNFGDETRVLFERALAIAIRNYGPDGLNTAVAIATIGDFHYRHAQTESTVNGERTQLLLAKSQLVESLRILTKIFGSNHVTNHEIAGPLASQLNDVLMKLSEL